ncbi:MAG: T9SS type A sorting domain-containing protein [Crocinitomicaceae bacterium]|nr:T9SS type A sorting domain-containing protein [Flavobacteriales bacterium]NQZ34270.1 T9SS type A sorting domain-containing protein [Crocinitomicaceae bacterium]
MKTTLYTLFSIFFIGSSLAQTVNTEVLDFNNVDATVSDGGVFFNYASSGLPGYSIPSGSQSHTIFAMSMWYGGVDANGQLKLSAQKYDPLSDQFKGPLSADGNALPDQSGSWNNAIFPVTKGEIIAHQANYATPGYVLPSNLANWPAHGDISYAQDFYLAPFVDVDGDGIYNPMSGDYPCIRGDQAVYVIMNDKGGVHQSGGDPIGIEMHYMFYEYTAPADIENTTFVHGKVINRGTQTLYDFKVSVFLDGDIGYYNDDYFASDSTRNLMYFYNGDNFDEDAIGMVGYSAAPPATGIVSLTNDFESIGRTDAIEHTAVGYWNLMNGMDITGTPWMNSVTMNPTSFAYASDPSSLTEFDSEVAQANIPGDRHGIATMDFGVFTPNAEIEFDYAVIYNRDMVSNLDNATGLGNVADIVQSFFDATVVDDCISNPVGLVELPQVNFSMYPNPSNGQFTLSIGTDFSTAEIEIYDLSGRNVLERTELNSKESNIELNESTGVYLLHLVVDGQKAVKRIIVE